MKRYDSGSYPGENAYYGEQKLSSRSFWHRYRWFILSSGILGVLVILLGSSTLYLLVNHTSGTEAPSPPRSALQSPQATQPARAETIAPTSTSILAAPTPRTIPENTSIPCVSSADMTCNDTAIDVQLVSIVIDPSYGPQGRLICNFMLTNKGPKPAKVDGGPDAFAKDSIFLQDPTGSPIKPDGGTLVSASNFATGVSLPLTVTFPLAPQHGVAYLLHINLGVSRDYSNGFSFSTATYQTFNLTV